MTTHEAPNGEDQWELFRFFLGNWMGTGTGEPGVCSVKRGYAPTLADRFIEITNRCDFAPQESDPSGEMHEDLGLTSHDQAGSLYVLREFHVEGYVNLYVLEPRAPDDEKLVFVTEAMENIPPGWRARITLEIISEDSFCEAFDLAGPGKPWACCLTSKLHRVP